MKKLKRTVDDILFLLRPAMKFGKGLLLLMLVIEALPALVNSLVTVAVPKVAIDELLNGTPVGRIILNVGVLILTQLAASVATNLLAYGYQIKQTEFSLSITKLILSQTIATDYRFLDKPEYYAKYQLTYQQFATGSQNIFYSFVSLLGALLTCAAMFTVIALLGPWVVLIVVAGTAAQVLVGLKGVKYEMQMSREVTEKTRGINYGSRMLQERQYAADMKVSSMGTYVLGWVDRYIGWIKSVYVRFTRPRAAVNTVSSLLNHATTLGTIAYVVWGISAGRIGSIGDYAALIAAGTTLSTQLRQLFGIFTDMARTAIQAEQAREFFDLPSVIESSTGETPPKEAWWAPDGCAIVSRSVLEEARKGKWPPEGTAPFYGLYAGEDLDPVSFEGTVLATSALPDPSKNDYDDCLQAILVELDSVLSETPSSADVERVVLVNVPVMEDRTIVGGNGFEPGDKVACTCAPYEAMPESILEIQLSDDIRSFEHRQYYPLRIEKIQAFRETGNKDFAKREISVFPVRSLPRDEKAAAARRERIQKEIARVESELARHGGTFEAWKEEYKPIAEKYVRLCEEGRAVWIGDSHFAAGCRETTYNTRAYIEGLLPYKKYLEENNIDLIVVRVPSRGDFAARVLASDDFVENPAWMEHYLECLKNDIEIVDPMPEMWKERFDFPLFYFYQDPDQRHPFEGTAMVMAKEIADVLQRYPYERNAPGIVLRDIQFKTRDALYHWPAGNEKRDPSENVVFKRALRDGEPCKDFAFRSGSPFLLLSNSYFWFPEWTLGASVPGYAAHFLEAIPDWRYRGGIDNQMITFLLEPHLLDGRRAVVMGGGFDAWKGFPTIPKYIPDGARRITLEKTVGASSGEMAIRDPAGSFERSAAGDGSVRFEFNGNYPERGDSFFDLDVSVPGIEGKRTAMIRVNFEQTSTLVVDLVDGGSGAVLDTVRVLPGRVSFADFFLPLAEGSSDVTIRVYPRNPETGLVVPNIELWYY